MRRTLHSIACARHDSASTVLKLIVYASPLVRAPSIGVSLEGLKNDSTARDDHEYLSVTVYTLDRITVRSEGSRDLKINPMKEMKYISVQLSPPVEHKLRIFLQLGNKQEKSKVTISILYLEQLQVMINSDVHDRAQLSSSLGFANSQLICA
jgi:hypothetical protein